MNRESKGTIVLGALVFVVFAVGLFQLFAIRFAAGDVYPAYSSLRADPLGVRALYESLDSVREVRVGRLYEPVDRLEAPQDTTLVWLGDRTKERPEDQWREFVYGGGRLVLGWAPTRYEDWSPTNKPGPFPWQQNRTGPQSFTPPERLSQDPRDVAFRDDWGVELRYLPLPEAGTNAPVGRAIQVADLDLPPQMSWHTTTCFTNLNEEWRVIYERESQPVVVERQFGDGSVVVTTDSFPFSNESLRSERYTRFLVWALGNNGRIIFDETHLGVESAQGIAGLMRRYRMHGLAVGALLLALIFLWRNTTSFLPRSRSAVTTSDGVIVGQGLATGFVRLLQRGIRKREILNTCFHEWKEGQATDRTCSEERVVRMEQAMMSLQDSGMTERDIVNTYGELHRIWKQRQHQKES